MPIFFKTLSAKELREAATSRSVVIHIVGAIEDHGDHLPLQIDLLEGLELSKRLAHLIEQTFPEIKVIIMPEIGLAVETHVSQNGIKYRSYVLRDYLVDTCRSLGKLGFGFHVCISGFFGPRQLTSIEEAGKILGRNIKLLSLTSALTSWKEVIKNPLSGSLGLPAKEHGGERDTSVGLALGVTTQEQIQTLPPISFKRGLFNKHRGYWGNPAQATLERGEKILQQQIDRIWPRLKKVLEGERPKSFFRSWYSLIPLNSSYFLAICLSVGALILILVWMAFFVRGLGLE